jgi:two-component system invasion response regulator UvrY
MNGKKKILIADDHAVVRKGIAQIISETANMIVAGEAANGYEVNEKVENEEFDAILLDIALPGKNGIETLKEIKRKKPKLPVLILSMYPEDQYAVRAIKAGASGYLTKESAPEELIEALKKVLRGGKYISPAFTEQLFSEISSNHKGPLHTKLSDRELEVLCLLARGKPIKQIANDLNLSAKTISTYRTRIMQKMAMKNNAEIIRYAFENGLISPRLE